MKELEQYCKGLADGNRLRMLNLLLHGELCGCDIQYVLDTSQPNISRHLQYLKNSGLVLDRRDGFRIFYRLAEPIQGTKKHLFEFLQQAFKNEEPFQDDTLKLKEAIQHGSCTRTEWRPYAALHRSSKQHDKRVVTTTRPKKGMQSWERWFRTRRRLPQLSDSTFLNDI